MRRRALIALLLPLGLLLAAPQAGPSGPLRFRIRLAGDLAPGGASGRLLVFMSDAPQPQKMLTSGFAPGRIWVAAMEVAHLAPGEPFQMIPDVKAYPRPFSQAKPGTYQFMALLDPDHSYPYTGRNGGDLYGPVVQVAAIDPAGTPPVELTLEKRTEARSYPDTDRIRRVEVRSALLSAFWGRPITMRAGVVLPPEFGKQPGKRYPTVYHVHGFGGDYSEAWTDGPRLIQGMASGDIAGMVHVFLDGSFSTGHHEFADSVNNGPWGTALIREFIPCLEAQFHLLPQPWARFLTGHSSGGWSTLWLEVNYPEFFGGAWSTAPDPVDLRSFTGIDVTPGSTDNAYRGPGGKPHNLIRRKGRELVSFEEFARYEDVLGEFGGQLASFEWVWSPKGPGGRPMQLFNRATGELDPAVESAWQKYDIRLVLERNWDALAPKLAGKVHVFCGGEDTFHLEEAVGLLCDFFKRKGSDAVCEIIPGRDHGTLLDDRLTDRILGEMAAQYRAAVKAQGAPARP